MQKLCIHGVDSMIGANLIGALAHHDNVAWQVPSGFDTANAEAWHEWLADESATAVVYCGVLSQSSWDIWPVEPELRPGAEQQAARCLEEVTALHALLAAAQRQRCVPILVSSDAVFAGPRIFHDETSPPQAVGPFADAARTLESMVARQGGLVLRTHAYGLSGGQAEPGYAERMWERLVAELPCPVDAHRHATPILASDLAELIYAAWQRELRGLYHATGAERASHYRFAAEMAVAGGLTGKQVRLGPPACGARPHTEETSLHTRSLRKVLGRPLPMLREGLARFVEQTENKFCQQLAMAVRPCMTAAA